MPPPVFSPGQELDTKQEVEARVCTGRGYRRISLPTGHYKIWEIWRDEGYAHDPEHSDGYTYRLRTFDRTNPTYGQRISIWQNDLVDAVWPEEEEEEED